MVLNYFGTTRATFIFLLLCLQTVTAGSAQQNARVKAVIFDVDGVIVDTECLKFQAWQAALQKHEISFDIAEYKQLVGLSNAKILQAIAIRRAIALPDGVIDVKEAAYRKLQAKGVVPIKPAVKLIQELAKFKAKLGIKLAVASSGRRDEIKTNLSQARVGSAFDVIISGLDDLGEIRDPEGVNKPKPYVYLKAARLLKVRPEDCLVYEDSGAGVEAASRAGMKVFAVPNAYTQNQKFPGASQILPEIHSFMQLSREIQKPQVRSGPRGPK